jgi:hypothetical protein
MNRYVGLWGIMLISIGGLLGIFGRKLFKPTICLMGGAATVFILLLLFYSLFFNTNTQSWVGWTVLIISSAIGSVVGLFLAKITRVGVAVLGACGGFCLGLILYSAFLYKFES